MAQIKISVFNDSTLLTDQAIAACVPAWQRQITEHFAPAWGTDAELIFLPKGTQPAAGTWWLVILDDSNQASAIGWHDTSPDGLPAGKVFVRADLDNHLEWSITASHELLEMLADPDVNLTTFIQDSAKSGKLYAYEVCDAVEDDHFGYTIDGTPVSNFVLPAYFQAGTAAAKIPGIKFDHCGVLPGPVPTLLSGGYLGEFAVAGGGGWTQNSAPTEGQPHRGHLRMNVPGSRADRRRRPRNDWRPSDTRLRPLPPN